MPRSRRKAILEAFKKFNKPPTLEMVKDYFKEKVEYHQEQINQLRREEQFVTQLTKTFWAGLKNFKSLKLRQQLGRHRPRPEAFGYLPSEVSITTVMCVYLYVRMFAHVSYFTRKQ